MTAAAARNRSSDDRKVRATFDASRLNAFSFDPETLVLIEDPKHPLYDARVTLPLPETFVANIKTLGVIEPVIVRKIDGDAVVIDGRQRVRAARLINKEAGEILIKVPAMARAGDEADAYTVTVSLNAQRQDDPMREKIAKAQRLAQLGRSEGDIALAMGITIATAKRLVASNAKARGATKKRGKSAAPSKAVVRKLLADGCSELSVREVTLLNFFEFGAGAAEFAAEFPKLAAAVAG